MPTMKLLLLGDDGANARDEGRLPRARDSRTNSREGHDAMVIMLWARGVRCLHTWKYQSIYTVMRHALLGWGAKGGSPPNEGRGEERRGSLFFMISLHSTKSISS